MFSATIALHSLVRWVVLLAGLITVARGLTGTIRRAPWSASDERAGLLFTISLDLQVVIGLILYTIVSPITTSAFQHLAGTMQNSVVRFWVVEHPTGMLLALAAAHIGRVRIRRANDLALKHRRAAIFYGAAFLLMLLSIPWPFTPVARPLWRF